jgi:hypothetical protein
MTDIRNADTVREVLLTTVPASTLSGMVREVLLGGVTAGQAAAVVREVLLVDAVISVQQQQYAVTVIS